MDDSRQLDFGMKRIVTMAFLCGSLLDVSAAGSILSQPYQWRNVVIGGGGFVTGIVIHPQVRDLIYARTDVGGAYRWDGSKQTWIPITDSFSDLDFTGIESLAVDPLDTNRVYLAAGIYENSKAAIFRSDDQGRTWQHTEVPFKMGGNETGRFNGERLAVDPSDNKTLFFGSRRDGLWKSQDYGVTWNHVRGFPDIAPENPASNGRRRFGNRPVGIICVLFDNAMVYAAVSTTGTNLFCSTDGGNQWSAVPNQPTGLRPNHVVLASDGILYLSYGKEAGPNAMTDGAVWKYAPTHHLWTDITPLKSPDEGQTFGYGAISVDTINPANIVATTFAHWRPHDEIFRSTNGGTTWTRLLANARWDCSSAPYTQKRTPHWLGTIQIDPFDSNHVLFTTGYGIWNCTNLTDADLGKPTQWSFGDEGLEETVPLALISPPVGPHLLSGLGDIDGFRHEDLAISPAEGDFSGPRFSTTEDLAFAEHNPGVIVRVGSGGSNATHAAVSVDSGRTWTLLEKDPAESSGGKVAISADGGTIVWTPRRAAPNYSRNNGKTWDLCAGLGQDVRVLADPVDAARFYAYDPETGKVLVSTNGGANFLQTDAALPTQRGFGSGSLSIAPGMEGDIWLACRDAGLFHSTNGGVSFAKLETVHSADALGFGKAAGGKTYPALYLIGEISGEHGVYRSDNAGENWVRINDAEHQYGWISHITGDPRIYGRVYFGTGGRGIIYGDPCR
jgi:photosystem II stability/assembly factor-like uncharacterized protein